MSSSSIGRIAFLACLLVLASLPKSAVAEIWPDRLPAVVRPVHQEVHLRVDPRETSFEGTVRADFRVEESSPSLFLHSEDMTIDEVRLQGPAGESFVTVERRADDVVELRAEEELAPGSYQIEMSFRSPYNTQAVGPYRMERDGEAYAFTQFEADDARKAFPGWDEPAHKIPFQVTLTVPEGFVAITNTPEETVTTEDGWTTVRYARTPPLPTYLLAFAVGRFETVDVPGLGVPGRVVVPRGSASLTGAAVEATPRILAAMEEWFGSPYPYRKLDLIAVPEFWPGAMEHPGAITYRDTALLLDPESSSLAQRRTLVRYTAHELAHQWFGNLVTMEWWDDLWLNEAFADWMGDKITHALHPEFGVPAIELGRTQRVMSGDAQRTSRSIRSEVKPGDRLMEGVGVTYLKGKRVLSQFEEWVGPEAFRAGVLLYLERHAWGNASADDLWAALDEASGRDLSGAMRSWLEQPGLPLVTLERVGRDRIRLSQQRFANHGSALDPQSWRIPVGLQWEDDAGRHRRIVLLEDAEKLVELPVAGEIRWVHPNAEARGYYRWSLAGPELADLARGARTNLSVLERREFLGNAAALTDAGVLRGDDALDVLVGFGGDPAAEVTTGLLAGLSKFRNTFSSPETDEALAQLGRHLLRPALDRIGLEERPGEPETDTALRPPLVRALGSWAADEEVAAHCRRRVDEYLVGAWPADPGLLGTQLWIAARDGDAARWEAYRDRFETASVPADRSRFLSALGGFTDPALRERSLAYIFEGPLQMQELFSIPVSMNDGAETADFLLDWYLDQWGRWEERLPRASLAQIASAGGGCSQERLRRVEEFFAQPEHDVPGLERRLGRVREQVGDCLALRDREGERVAEWLAAFDAATR